MEDKNALKTFYKIGGITALLQLTIVPLFIVVTPLLGTRPTEVRDFFEMYQTNKLAGLLRDDLSSLLMVVLYLGSLPALFYSLRKVNPVYTTFACLFTLVVVAGSISTNSSLSFLHLSDQYAAAGSEAQRAQILAAGEAVLVSDMWNSTGAYFSGILLQGSGVIFSLLMLRSRDFGKITAWSGLLANALDLTQHVLHPFAPGVSAFISMFFGLFYLVWFPMLARDFLRLSRKTMADQS